MKQVDINIKACDESLRKHLEITEKYWMGGDDPSLESFYTPLQTNLLLMSLVARIDKIIYLFEEQYHGD